MGLSEAATRVLAHAAARPATLGRGRLICIDGPSGAGKTTLAAAIARLDPAAQVLHTDAMLEGWRGLPGLGDHLTALLGPLADGAEGRWRQWDWDAASWAGWHVVRPSALVVLEGVGSAAPAIAHLVTTAVWVEAPESLRRQRWWDREGETTIAHRDQWVLDETALHAAQATRERSDLVIDGAN